MGQRASAEYFDNPFLVICQKVQADPALIFEGNFQTLIKKRNCTRFAKIIIPVKTKKVNTAIQLL